MGRRASGHLLLGSAGLVLLFFVVETAYTLWSDRQMREASTRLNAVLDGLPVDPAKVLIAELERMRTRFQQVEVLLGATGGFLATTATVVGVRAMRRHNRFMDAKARELEHFASTVAHDVLGPLSAVGLAMPLIQHRHAGDDETQRLTERALSSIRRVRNIVDAILAFARAGARPTPGRADVRATMEEAVHDLQKEGIDIDIRVERGSGVVACMPGVLLSILGNLLHNAAKFMPKSGSRRIDLRAYRWQGNIAIEVEDSGPGIPDGLRETVFDPYFRIDLQQPGLGLGLATVKRLVVAHGGNVEVREGRTGGALFWFELPAGLERRSLSRSSVPAATAPGPSPTSATS